MAKRLENFWVEVEGPEKQKKMVEKGKQKGSRWSLVSARDAELAATGKIAGGGGSAGEAGAPEKGEQKDSS